MKPAAVLFVLVVALAAGPGLGAQEEAVGEPPGDVLPPARFPYTVTLSAGFGLFAGQAEEIVYAGSSKTSLPAWDDDDKLSQLLWDLKPLVYGGVGAVFAPRDPWTRSGFYLETGVSLGIPGRVGVMEDRDWQDDDDPNQLTNYSHHDASITGAVLWDTQAGFSWAVHPAVYLRFWGAYSYHYFAWSGDDGYTQYATAITEGQYGPWDASIPKDPQEGTVITYSQSWYFYGLGLSVTVKPLPRFQAALSFSLSPPLYLDFGSFQIANWAKCVDNHVKRKKIFTDYVLRGVSLTAGLELAYALLDNLDLVLTGTYRYSGDYKGPTYQGALAAGTGGAGVWYLDAALTVRLALF